MLRKITIMCLCLCACSGCSKNKPASERTSILDLPGTTIESPFFESLERHLDLSLLNDSVYTSSLKSIFPEAENFYDSKLLPMLIVVDNGKISVICLGKPYKNLMDLSNNGTKIDPCAMLNMGHFLEQAGLYIPYEIFISTDPESTIRVFVDPYMDSPRIKHENNATVIDFVGCNDAYYKMKIYFLEGKFCSLRVLDRSRKIQASKE